MYLNMKNHFHIDEVREKRLLSFREDLRKQRVNPEDYSLEMVESRLRSLLSKKEVDNRDIRLVNRNGYIYIAPPVLMAMCIGQYQLAQELVEKGYPTTCSGEELGAHKAMIDVKCPIADVRGYVWSDNYEDDFCVPFYPISLGQYVFWSEHISEELRLYFWNQVHKEKEDYGNYYNVHCEKVFDFGMLCDQGKNVAIDLREHRRLSQQILDCLSLFLKHNPDSLKHIFDCSWERIFHMFLEKSQEELAFFLLDYVLESDQDKLELLSVIGDMQKCGEPNSNSPFVPTNEFGKLWVHFYKKMCTYYLDDDILREQFFITLVYDYIKIYRSYDNLPFDIRSKEEELYEKQFLSILKSVMPSTMSFKKLLSLFAKDCCIEKKRDIGRMSDLDRLCQLYGQKLSGDIILKDGIGDLEEGDILSYYIHREHNPIDDVVWCQYVDRFEFEKSSPLNKLQRSLLECVNVDLLLHSIERGLFASEQYQIALDYCVNKPDLSSLIPCLLAFRNQ